MTHVPLRHATLVVHVELPKLLAMEQPPVKSALFKPPRDEKVKTLSQKGL